MIWTTGSADIQKLLAARELTRIAGDATEGTEWIAMAETRLNSAQSIRSDDPESAFILTYESVHIVGMGILAQQGLRPTTTGGHIAVETALRAQFGDSFTAYGWMRRTRHQSMYPAFPGDQISEEVVGEAFDDAHAMIDAARKLVPQLSMFRADPKQ